MPTSRVAVLGGGISGLSAAYHLSRLLPPSARIVLLERQQRLGGWLQSTPLTTQDDSDKDSGRVLEAGPRTLRPNSLAIMELIHRLELDNSLVIVPKTHPAARARFIDFPPLTLLPASLPSLLASPANPALRGLLPAILAEPFRTSSPPAIANNILSEAATGVAAKVLDKDESLYSLISRRFGDRFAREYLSAIIHGIYATDARALSVRATFPFLWDASRSPSSSSSLSDGSSRSILREPAPRHNYYDTGAIEAKLKGAAMYTFRGGIQTLSDALRRNLQDTPNVELWTGVGATRIVPREEGIEIFTTTGATQPFMATHVVSAVQLPILDKLLKTGSVYLPHLDAKTNPASSVLVVNLIFPPQTTPSASSPSQGPNSSAGALLHPDGFGCLVPRPQSGYLTQAEVDARANSRGPDEEVDISHALLGVVFDSAVDPDAGSPSATEQPTRLTLMLGGPHPLPQTISTNPTSNVDLNRFIPPLLRHLARTLSWPSSSPIPTPSRIRAEYHQNCIPIYTLGHVQRMRELKQALGFDTAKGPWKGRLHVVGAGVRGISLGDCVSSGRDAAFAIAQSVGPAA
ncbi:Protoporphyrinogen oxidase [Clavulina sp. PMI_390]|nr:Protoporphyrinogen oxidase [Clavulina sp. PMI_390]